jgi:purine-nucleoside phosphorylase
MLQQTKKYLQEKILLQPEIAVVLGSGLGSFADDLDERLEIPYDEIPGWPRSTAVGHAGKLVVGKINEVLVLALSGRAHLYEGYSPARVTYAVRVLKLLGIRSLVITNAAGGINLDFARGKLVLITDHINLQGVNPLVGANEDDLGPRFPDMTEAYSFRFRQAAKQIAAEMNIDLSEGVYAAMLGPSYETPAEIRFLRSIGADLVGMSTVPEVIIANHMGLEVLGISCVTNMAAGILPGKINHEEVLQTGFEVRETFVALLKALLPRLAAEGRHR